MRDCADVKPRPPLSVNFTLVWFQRVEKVRSSFSVAENVSVKNSDMVDTSESAAVPSSGTKLLVPRVDLSAFSDANSWLELKHHVAIRVTSASNQLISCLSNKIIIKGILQRKAVVFLSSITAVL